MKDTVTMLVEALEECKRWHQGDKWRDFSPSSTEHAAWTEHAIMLDTALSAAKGGGWLPMESAPSFTRVYVAFRNEYGKIETAVAYYVEKHKEEAGEDDQAVEYDPETDTEYLMAGWYENNTVEETNYLLTGVFLGWQPLPPPPKD